MAAWLLHLRHLLHSVRPRALPSSPIVNPPLSPPYAVHGRPRHLSAQSQAATGSDHSHNGGDNSSSGTLECVRSFLVASLAVWMVGHVTAWKRGEEGSARLQKIKDDIDKLDIEIQRLEEEKKKSIHKPPVGDHQLQAERYKAYMNKLRVDIPPAGLGQNSLDVISQAQRDQMHLGEE